MQLIQTTPSFLKKLYFKRFAVPHQKLDLLKKNLSFGNTTQTISDSAIVKEILKVIKNE